MLLASLWWVDAPKRNAQRLLGMIHEGNYEDANHALSGVATISRNKKGEVRLELPNGIIFLGSKSDVHFKEAFALDKVYWIDRTFHDMLLSRVSFVVGNPYFVWTNESSDFAIDVR